MEGSVSRRTLVLRYPATCSLCRSELPRGAKAWWDKEAKAATCLVCGSGAELARDLAGIAGGSGRQKYERLHEHREKEIKGALGEKLGSVYLFLKDEPQSTRAWKTGSDGEERLAKFFEKELPESAIVLHDRRIPGSRANIDHIVVAPSGVWVIDAKAYGGKVERRTIGSIWNAQNRVFVAGRDRQARPCDAAPARSDPVGAGCGSARVRGDRACSRLLRVVRLGLSSQSRSSCTGSRLSGRRSFRSESPPLDN